MPGLTGILRVMGVAFTSNYNGIAAGDTNPDTVSPGAISHTADAGRTWTLIPIPRTSQLRGATSYKSSIWVVGEGGTLLRSGDGGSSWGTQTSWTTQPLWGVQALSNDFIVAVGGGGTIITGGRPNATVSKPALGMAVHKGGTLQITGTVKPHVPNSTTKVVIYKSVSGKWQVWKTLSAQNFSYTSYSRYWANTTASSKGTFSAIATFAHPDYRTTSSARFTFTVK
jgi:hypothetical protein